MTIAPAFLGLLGLLLSAVTALITGGVTWGTFREQLRMQGAEIKDLKVEIHKLTITVHELTLKLVIVADRHERDCDERRGKEGKQ
jgi:hypothetical protein